MFTQELGASPPPDALSSTCYSPLLALVCSILARNLSVSPPADAPSFTLLLLVLAVLRFWVARSVTRFSESCRNASPRCGRHSKALPLEYCAGRRRQYLHHARVRLIVALLPRLIATSRWGRRCRHKLQHDRECFSVLLLPGRLRLGRADVSVDTTSEPCESP